MSLQSFDFPIDIPSRFSQIFESVLPLVAPQIFYSVSDVEIHVLGDLNTLHTAWMGVVVLRFVYWVKIHLPSLSLCLSKKTMVSPICLASRLQPGFWSCVHLCPMTYRPLTLFSAFAECPLLRPNNVVTSICSHPSQSARLPK